MDFDDIICELEELSDDDFAENMKKFGIRYVKSYGLRLPQIRKIAKGCGKDHEFIPQARDNIFVWCSAEEEFVKRTAFSLIAVLAVHEKGSDFDKYFDILKEGSKDNRNFVKKSVNWAIRQIGKSNLENNQKAIELSYDIMEIDNKSSKWVARNALKELESDKVQEKLAKSTSQ